MTVRYRLVSLHFFIPLLSLVGCVGISPIDKIGESTHQSNNEIYQHRELTSGGERVVSESELLNDTAITNKVKEGILNEPYLRSEKISVETFNGKVHLSGFVSTLFGMSKAIEISRRVKGVVDVKDEMRLMGQH